MLADATGVAPNELIRSEWILQGVILCEGQYQCSIDGLDGIKHV